MTYEILMANPRPIRVTRRPRRGGGARIKQIQIHATRGPSTMNTQLQRTVSYFANNRAYPQGNNHGSWGGSADFVIGPDHAGEIQIIQFGNWLSTFSSWSAGFGSRGPAYEYGAAEVGVAIELSQPPRLEAGHYQAGDSDVPFTDETMDALVWLCEWINDGLEGGGHQPVLPQRIPGWDQSLEHPIPRGYIGHEDLANGVRTGKTDPGAMFDWPWFMAKMRGAGSDDVMSPPPDRLEVAMRAWTTGAAPLPMDGNVRRYEVRMPAGS